MTQANLATGLVAYYPFNGNANDASGNKNIGVVHSAVLSTDRFGNPSSSYTFNRNAYIEINGASFEFINNFAISLWINPASSQTTYSEIFSKSHNSFNGFQFEQQASSTNYYCLGYYYTSGSGRSSCVQFIANNWNHFVFTKADTIASYYLNGALTATTTAPSTGVVTAQGLPLLFGAWNSGYTSPASGVTRYYNGAIDDIYIYNRSLSSGEIQKLYGMTPTTMPTLLPTAAPTTAPTAIPIVVPSAIPTHPVLPPTSAAAKNFNLASLTNNQGFNITGASDGDYSGWSVSNAGDVNKDGYADMIIGAYGASPNGKSAAGASYVVYGGAFLTNINLANLISTEGFSISGAASNDQSGWSISGAGDVNGDGFDDIIIGAPYASPIGRSNAGTSYIIYGGASLTNVNLASLSSAQGFSIIGKASYVSGYSVSSAGDVNNDGYDDVVIGTGGAWTALVYIVFGNPSCINIDLSSLTANQGFYITGMYNNGFPATGAGDFNGDGYDDIIIGNSHASPSSRSYAGQSFLIYGGPSSSNVNAVNLNYTQGFSIIGASTQAFCGGAVSGVGDINNDGFEDIIIGSGPSTNVFIQQSYIIYGKPSSVNIDLLSLSPKKGFSISGSYGLSVSGAGDFNNDGYADFTIGVPNASPNRLASAGISYLIYGGSELTNINLATLTFSQGLSISGAQAGENSGYSLSGAGDINGDGYDDLIIGAYLADATSLINPGASYIVYGGYFTLSSAPTKSPIATPTLSPTKTPTHAPSGPTPFPTKTPLAPTLSPTLDQTKAPANSGAAQDIKNIIAAGSSIGSASLALATYLCKNFFWNNGVNIKFVDNSSYKKVFQFCDVISFRQLKELARNSRELSSNTAKIAADNAEKIANTLKCAAEDAFTPAEEHTIKAATQAEMAAKTSVTAATFAKNSMMTATIAEKLKKIAIQSEEIVEQAATVKTITDAQVIEDAANNISREAEDVFQKARERIDSATKARNEHNEALKLKTLKSLKSNTLNQNDIEENNKELVMLEQNVEYTQEFTKAQQYGAAEAVQSDFNDEEGNNSPSSTDLIEIPAVQGFLLGDVYTNDDRIPTAFSKNRYKNIPTQVQESDRPGLLCIDTSMDPEYIKIQDKAFAEFGEHLMLAYKDLGYLFDNGANEIQKLLSDSSREAASIEIYQEQPTQPKTSTSNHLMPSLFGVRQFIEYLPLIKHLAQGAMEKFGYNTTTPEILDNKPFLFTIHLVAGHAGAMLLPQDDMNDGLVVATAGSMSYGARLIASHCLTEQRQEILLQDKAMDAYEMTKYCSSTILAYTAPSLATCAISNFMLPGTPCAVTGYDLIISTSFGGSECYSVYKTKTQDENKTTADTVVPYIVDAVAMAYASQYLGFDSSSLATMMLSVKQDLAVVSSVVATDYISRVAIDIVPDEFKEDYVDPVFDYAYNAINDLGTYMVNGGNALIGYFAMEHAA